MKSIALSAVVMLASAGACPTPGSPITLNCLPLTNARSPIHVTFDVTARTVTSPQYTGAAQFTDDAVQWTFLVSGTNDVGPYTITVPAAYDRDTAVLTIGSTTPGSRPQSYQCAYAGRIF